MFYAKYLITTLVDIPTLKKTYTKRLHFVIHLQYLHKLSNNNIIHT